MPELSDKRHEAYCMFRAGGMSQTQAAINAGYAVGSANNGSRLEKRPEVKARLAELEEQNTQSQDTSEPKNRIEQYSRKPFIVTETVHIHRLARKNKEYNVSLNCLRLLAQLGGLLDTGSGKNATQGPKSLTQINLNTMTAKDLGAYLKQSVADLPHEQRKALAAAMPDIIDVDSDPEPGA